MAYQKFLTLVNGIKTLASAITSSAGVGDANKIIATDAAGTIDPSLLPPGVEIQTLSVVTSENLVAGDFVNIYDDTGTPTARKADGTLARYANGFVLAGVTSPAAATVYTKGLNNQVSGRTPGAIQFLGSTGATSETALAETSGYINQILGFAASATSVVFEFDEYIDIE